KGEVLLEQKHDPRKIKIIFILIWLALVLFYIQGKLYPANTIIPSNIIIDILVRSIFIILTWYILLSPIIMILIRKLIYKHQSRYHDEMKEVLKLIPETKHIFTHSLELSSAEKGFSRLKSFLKILLINILSE
ncbi:MAG: hypothetical protein ABIO04_14710, partial [Ferruginibacter sp.]